MKRYSATGEHPTGAYVLHSDHEAALAEAVATEQLVWVEAITKTLPRLLQQAVAAAVVTARGAAHD